MMITGYFEGQRTHLGSLGKTIEECVLASLERSRQESCKDGIRGFQAAQPVPRVFFSSDPYRFRGIGHGIININAPKYRNIWHLWWFNGIEWFFYGDFMVIHMNLANRNIGYLWEIPSSNGA